MNIPLTPRSYSDEIPQFFEIHIREGDEHRVSEEQQSVSSEDDLVSPEPSLGALSFRAGDGRKLVHAKSAPVKGDGKGGWQNIAVSSDKEKRPKRSDGVGLNLLRANSELREPSGDNKPEGQPTSTVVLHSEMRRGLHRKEQHNEAPRKGNALLSFVQRCFGCGTR